jgi:hypothetical protein
VRDIDVANIGGRTMAQAIAERMSAKMRQWRDSARTRRLAW